MRAVGVLPELLKCGMVSQGGHLWRGAECREGLAASHRWWSLKEGTQTVDASLYVVKEDGGSQSVVLRKPRVVVGRESGCELRIPLASVSRQHCEFLLEDGKVTVRDLGSSNGTFVNRERIEEAELSIGDLVAVGPAVFVLMVDGQPEGLSPADVYARGSVEVKAKTHGGVAGSAAKAAAALAGGVDDSDLDMQFGDDSDDSSMIDFDFDFEDDDDDQPEL